MIAHWPGRIRAGSVCDTPVHVVDLMPTMLGLARAGVPDGYGMDGIDLGPLLRGGRVAPWALYWYHPFYDLRWLATPNAVMRGENWKLIESFGDYFDEEQHARYAGGAGGQDIGGVARVDPGVRHRSGGTQPRLGGGAGV
jgi:arylsulfatase A-like enzyme